MLLPTVAPGAEIAGDSLNNPTTSDDRRILPEQVKLLYRQSAAGLAATPLLTTIAVPFLWNVVDQTQLLAWYGVSNLIIVLRYGLAIWYRRSQDHDEHAERWRDRFMIAVLASGANWGFAGFFLFPDQSPIHQAFLVIIIVGVTGGAVSLLSPLRRVFFPFLLLVSAPLIARLALSGEPILLFVGATIGVFVLIMASSAVTSYRASTNAIKLAFENTDLVEENSSILETLIEGVITIDDSGTIETFNPSAESIFGYATGEVIGQNVRILMTSEDRSRHDGYIHNYLKTRDAKIIGIGREVTGQRKDGTTFPMRLGIGEMEINGQRKFVGTVHDVSEQRFALSALQESEANLRNLTDLVPVGIYRADPDGGITYANDRALRVARTQVEGASYLGNAWQRYIYPEDSEPFASEFLAAVKAERPFTGEYRFGTPSGRVTWALSQATPEIDQNGNLIGYVGTLTDITERKLAEQAQAESERILRNITELTPVGIYQSDPDGHLNYVNDRWSEIMGLEGDAALDDGWINSMHPEDRDPVIEAWQAYVNGDSEKYRIECRIVRPDGSTNWLISQAARDYGENGELLGYVGSMTDITARRRAEAKLEESDTRYRDLYDNAPFAYASVNPDDRSLTDCNEALADLLGYTRDELTGMTVQQFYADTVDGIPKAAVLFEQLKLGESVENAELQMKRKDGETIWVNLSVSQKTDTSGKPIENRAIVVDLTDRKMAEFDLLVAKEQAEAANKAKSAFLSSMSHELRTPMNAILGFSQLLEQDATGPLNQNQREFVEEILRSGHHMLELIGDVLDLAKIESGGVNLDLKSQAPRPLIDACLQMVGASADQGGITVRSQYPADEMPMIKVDALRFKQALLNLLSNAVKYNCVNGDVILECNSGANGILHITVSDTGPGIPDAMCAKVFEPFDRLGAESSNITGSGIGLTVTKDLVESMGGAVGFDSIVGEGTTFWIDLPVAPV
jgi:PAS domain S-box-containing protein